MRINRKAFSCLTLTACSILLLAQSIYPAASFAADSQQSLGGSNFTNSLPQSNSSGGGVFHYRSPFSNPLSQEEREEPGADQPFSNPLRSGDDTSSSPAEPVQANNTNSITNKSAAWYKFLGPSLDLSRTLGQSERKRLLSTVPMPMDIRSRDHHKSDCHIVLLRAENDSDYYCFKTIWGSLFGRSGALILVSSSGLVVRMLNLNGHEKDVLFKLPNGQIVTIGPGSEMILSKVLSPHDLNISDGIARRGLSRTMKCSEMQMAFAQFSHASVFELPEMKFFTKNQSPTALAALKATVSRLDEIRGTNGFTLAVSNSEPTPQKDHVTPSAPPRKVVVKLVPVPKPGDANAARSKDSKTTAKTDLPSAQNTEREKKIAKAKEDAEAIQKKELALKKEAELKKESALRKEAQEKAAADKETAREKKTALEKEKALKKEIALKKEAADKKAALEKAEALEKEKAEALKKEQALERKLALKKESALKKELALKKEAAEKAAAEKAEKQAALEKKAAREKEAALEKQAALEKKAAREKEAALEKQAALEKKAAREKEAALEKQAALEKKAARDKEAALEKQATLEQKAARQKEVLEKQIALEQKAARQKEVLEKQTALEQKAAREREVALEKQAALEQKAAREKEVALEKQTALAKKASRQREALEEQTALQRKTSRDKEAREIALKKDAELKKEIAFKKEQSPAAQKNKPETIAARAGLLGGLSALRLKPKREEPANSALKTAKAENEQAESTSAGAGSSSSSALEKAKLKDVILLGGKIKERISKTIETRIPKPVHLASLAPKKAAVPVPAKNVANPSPKSTASPASNSVATTSAPRMLLPRRVPGTDTAPDIAKLLLEANREEKAASALRKKADKCIDYINAGLMTYEQQKRIETQARQALKQANEAEERSQALRRKVEIAESGKYSVQ